tara:strand:+ start:828 stop:1358 length:531 start_codon:yes stop_codon:yes gene_type:complete
MRYLANTSFIKTQTVPDTSPVLRVKDICRSHKWTAATLSAGELNASDTMSITSLHNVDIATDSASMDEANSIYLGKRWREWNEDGHKDLCVKLEEAANLAELTLENCERSIKDYSNNIERELLYRNDRLIEVMKSARRAIYRCNADNAQHQQMHASTLKRLNAALYEMTQHRGYKP